MNRFFIVLLILFNLSLTFYVWKYWRQIRELEKWNSSQVFVPSNEWQRIEKNQSVPRGIHVRLNMKTGEREAKLLEKGQDSRSSMSALEISDDDVNRGIIEYSTEDVGTLETDAKKKFRSYEELMKELDEVKIKVRTDMEVLDELFSQIKKYNNVESWCSQETGTEIGILDNLETLLHQVDNAREFTKRNGMNEVLKPCLKSSSTKLRTAAARVLGAAAQNNAFVQIGFLKSGALSLLLEIINDANSDFEIRSSSISSLSCLVRLFPFAQLQFLKEGGIRVLLSLFDESTPDAFKLQMKVVNLFYDLLTEEDSAELAAKEYSLLRNNNTDGVELNRIMEKQEQYSRINLKNVLINHGWCSKLSHLLATKVVPSDLRDDVSESKLDHDVLDKVVNALSSVAFECKETFKKDTKFSFILHNLLHYYQVLSSKDDFFVDIHNLLKFVTEEVNTH